MSPHRFVCAALALLLPGLPPALARDGFPSLDGDFAAVCQTAFERARRPFVAPRQPPLPAFDPPATGALEDPGLVFDEYNRIRTLKPLYNDGFLWIDPRPRGNVQKGPIELWYAPAVGRPYQPGTYRLTDFDYRDPAIQPPLPAAIPDAARIISALDFGSRLGLARSWPQFGYLGASAYLRLAGLDTRFGTSLRLGAYDVGWAESKPHLTKLLVRPLLYHRFALFGVIESAPFTACIQSVTTADLSTRAQTTLRLYPRAGFSGPPGARVSPLAMSSMFWKGEGDTPADPSDEAHDADAMQVCGQAAFPLQGFVPAPGARAAFRDFGAGRCFGLIQLDRVPAHYRAYDSALYAERVSLWVDDLHSDLAFTIKLMAYGTNYEGEDNVVAYAEFLDDLPVPLASDDAATFSYTLTASALPPPQAGPRLTLGETGPGDRVGAAVAMSGERFAVGVPAILGRRGSVDVFRRAESGLIAERRLTPDDGTPGDHFGSSLALSGDTLAVAAPAAGAVYVFVRRALDWVQQARLAIPVTYSVWALAQPVALSGDSLVVGVPGDDGGAGGRATDTGAVFVFRRHGDTWRQEALLRAPDREPWDHFGEALALDGDTLAVGAPGDDYPQAWEQGAVYLFAHVGDAWVQTQKLTEPGGWKDYGAAVALSGSRLLVGAPRAHGNGWRTAAGGVCAYVRGAGLWSLKECFRPADWHNGDQFGAALALTGDSAAIGAPGALNGRGAAYGYRYARGTWGPLGRWTADADAVGQFGVATATDGRAWLIGAPPPAGREEAQTGGIWFFSAAAP